MCVCYGVSSYFVRLISIAEQIVYVTTELLVCSVELSLWFSFVIRPIFPELL